MEQRPQRRPRRIRIRVPWTTLLGLLLVAGLAVALYTGWTLRRVDRALQKVTTQAVTRLELKEIAELVRLNHLATESYPADFPSFLAASRRPRKGRKPWQDSWGGEFRLKTGAQGFEVRSPGPDRMPYTRDDLVERGSVVDLKVR